MRGLSVDWRFPARTNLAAIPRVTAWNTTNGVMALQNSRWFGSGAAAGTYSLVTGAADGPDEIDTYGRKTWTVAPADVGSSNDTGFETPPKAMAVKPGQTFTASCWMRASVSRFLYWQFYAYDSSNGQLPNLPVSHGAVRAANVWSLVWETVTIPQGCAYIRPIADSSRSSPENWGVGDTLDITGLLVERDAPVNARTGGIAPYFDGSMPGAAWTGTPNRSTSVTAGNAGY